LSATTRTNLEMSTGEITMLNAFINNYGLVHLIQTNKEI
jgi:hypothetical protein